MLALRLLGRASGGAAHIGRGAAHDTADRTWWARRARTHVALRASDQDGFCSGARGGVAGRPNPLQACLPPARACVARLVLAMFACMFGSEWQARLCFCSLSGCERIEAHGAMSSGCLREGLALTASVSALASALPHLASREAHRAVWSKCAPSIRTSRASPPPPSPPLAPFTAHLLITCGQPAALVAQRLTRWPRRARLPRRSLDLRAGR